MFFICSQAPHRFAGYPVRSALGARRSASPRAAICSPGYRNGNAGSGSIKEVRGKVETLNNLSDAEPDWPSVFFPGTTTAPAGSMIFSGCAIVAQAALPGQGAVLGWLNITAYWLRTRRSCYCGRA